VARKPGWEISIRRLALALSAALLAVALLAARPPSASAIVVTQYAVPGVALPSQIVDIAAGPDGNLWFVVNSIGDRAAIGRITPAGVSTLFELPRTAPSLKAIAAGPDGNLWFTETCCVGRITPAGVVTEFPLPDPNSGPNGITSGPDGNLWFTENANRISRITPAGVITEFSAGLSPGANPVAITAGPDGNLWFTSWNNGAIGRITPAGVITEFTEGISNIVVSIPLPAATTRVMNGIYDIAAGPDGNLWFTEAILNKVGRITPAGVVTEFDLPPGPGGAVTSDPRDITAAPDGNLWVTEDYGTRLARFGTDGGGARVRPQCGTSGRDRHRLRRQPLVPRRPGDLPGHPESRPADRPGVGRPGARTAFLAQLSLARSGARHLALVRLSRDGRLTLRLERAAGRPARFRLLRRVVTGPMRAGVRRAVALGAPLAAGSYRLVAGAVGAGARERDVIRFRVGADRRLLVEAGRR